MAQDLTGKYYVKNSAGGSFTDVTSMFNGLRILKVDGFLSKGKPVNIYTAQWVDAQAEDFLVVTPASGGATVIRENVDLEVTFIVRKKYASSGSNIDVMSVHDNFVNYMTSTDVWIRSAYVGNKSVHCVCLKEYKPTTQKLQRGDDSWIMGTITLHCLDAPQNA